MTVMAGLIYQVGLISSQICLPSSVGMLFKWQILLLFPFWLQLVETLQWKESFLGPLEVQQWALQTARRPHLVAPSVVSVKISVNYMKWMANQIPNSYIKIILLWYVKCFQRFTNIVLFRLHLIHLKTSIWDLVTDAALLSSHKQWNVKLCLLYCLLLSLATYWSIHSYLRPSCFLLSYLCSQLH